MEKLDIKYTVSDIAEVLNSKEAENFLVVMGKVEMIMERPETLVGSKALVLAAQLAAHRTFIGQWAQVYKTSEKSMTSRKRKDILLNLYVSLEEVINTLKLLGRIEAKHL